MSGAVPTSLAFVHEAAIAARKYLKRVYTGNI
jgi:hypothetical protein